MIFAPGCWRRLTQKKRPPPREGQRARSLGGNAHAGTATIVLYLSFIASALFFCLGIIGEYLAVIIKEVKRRPVTVAAECTEEAEG